MSTPTDLERRVDVLSAKVRRMEERMAMAEDKLTRVRVYSPGRPWWQWRLALTEEQWRTLGIALLALSVLVEPMIRKRNP